MPNRASIITTLTQDLESKTGLKCLGVDKSIITEEVLYHMNNGDVYISENGDWKRIATAKSPVAAIIDLFKWVFKRAS